MSLITCTGTEDEIMDWLGDYCGGDIEAALDLFEHIEPTDVPGCYRMTLDWSRPEVVRLATVGLFVASIGPRAVRWRASKHLGMGAEHLVAKLAEEVGEVARAVIGDLELRPGRGDARQESAQVVILLAALLELHYDGDLLEHVRVEMERAGA